MNTKQFDKKILSKVAQNYSKKGGRRSGETSFSCN
jgi:hypothetical protein